MSEKLSVNIEILGINAEHHYLVPDDMNVSKMIQLIVQTLSEEYPGIGGCGMERHFLIHSKSGKVLDNSCSLRQLGITNGEKSILM